MPKIVVFSIYILIEQEGVLSQQAAEVKAKEKWLYLTQRICIFPGRDALLSFLDKSIKRKGLD